LKQNSCIDATIKCGFEHGLHMIVPAYSNTTVENKFMSAEQTYRYYNEFIWNGRYAECIPLEQALKMMR
ncbi:cysteine hydrolase, partial [Clostridium botulinum]|nr:cysteine hydrolase [Clostridium botulinum]